MTSSSQAPQFTYYGFCGYLDALIRDLIPNVSNGHKHGFRGTAQLIHDVRHKPKNGALRTEKNIDETQLLLSGALENSLSKRALAYGSFNLDLQLGDSVSDLQQDLDILFSECSTHIDLYRDNHLYFTYAEADQDQAVAQRKAFQNLAASRWIRENDPHKFDDVLGVFEKMESEGPPDYWQLVILCMSPWL